MDRFLKKAPDHAPAKVLKALALLRSEKPDEARAIFEQLTDAEFEECLSCGDAAADALMSCYKESNQRKLPSK